MSAPAIAWFSSNDPNMPKRESERDGDRRTMWYGAFSCKFYRRIRRIFTTSDMPCFRKGAVVSLNDKAYIWKDGDWIEVQPSIKMNNINLVGKFEELDNNESEYMLKPHEAFDSEEEEEQINQ